MPRSSGERSRPATVLSHLGVMVAVSVVLGVVVSGLAIPFAGLLGFGARQAAEAVDDLPQDFEADALPQTTTILDANGDVLARVFDQNRTNVRLDQVSRMMVKAIVSIEDFRFYEHGALDVKGTARAFITNKAAGGVTQGGSSITQQLVKLTLVNQADSPEEQAAALKESYARKIRELRYAIALEKKHSKDWILERYLNTAYFGAGAYGIQAAAQRYFGVDAKKLNVRQSAMLAGLVQNPSQFDPTRDPDAAKQRRNVVLDRMAQLGAVGEKRADKVKTQNLGLRVQNLNNGCTSSYAPFFCQYAVNYLAQDPALGKNRKAREELIRTGGLTIQTTIDPDIQQAADDSVSANVDPTDTAIGAIAMVEPGTGAVKALAQSRPIGNDRAAGETYLNYTVPKRYGNANGFQAGSTFKAFTLAAALDQGISPYQTFPGTEGQAFDLGDFDTCDGKYQSSEIFTPSNSTGDFTPNLYVGTQKSVNVFFYNLELATGICQPYRLAKSMGVKLTDPADEIRPTFTLGVIDVSPLEMTEAYATFAARGMHCDSVPVTSIKDSSGKTVLDFDPTCSQVMPSAVADRVNDILSGVTAPGGFGAGISLPDGRDDAGKTGTTTGSVSVWFNGYTPDLAAAAVLAGVDEAGNQEGLDGKVVGGSYISGASGSGTAGPIWGQAMAAAAPYFGSDSFTPPAATVDGTLTTVPDVTGLSLEEAQSTLSGAGLRAQVGNYRDSDLDRDLVAATGPRANARLSRGDAVTLYPSRGGSS